jgi:hypothetical protein
LLRGRHLAARELSLLRNRPVSPASCRLPCLPDIQTEKTSVKQFGTQHEKRFSQLKTDFRVAPVYLKEVSRIQALLCVYFLVLLIESLLERELRRAMAREQLESLPLYPEGRPCRRPTARRVIDLFEDIQRHTVRGDSPDETVFVTELTDLQRQVLKLLGVPATDYRA